MSPRPFLLIGLTGPAGAGKDTVADFLTEAHGMKKLALADPIRAGLQAMLDVPALRLTLRETKESRIGWLGKSPRELMQSLGTEWGRQHVAPDLWLRIATRKIDALHSSHAPGAVVSDIRFPDEAEWLRGRGGVLMHLHRPGAGLSGRAADHASEAGVEMGPQDLLIWNNGTKTALYDQVREIVGKLIDAASQERLT